MQKNHWTDRQRSCEYFCCGNQIACRLRLRWCLCSRSGALEEQGPTGGACSLALTLRVSSTLLTLNKQELNQGYWRFLPSSIPFLSLASLPRVMLSAEYSHPDSYLSCGNIVNANSCFLFITNRPVSEQPCTRDVKPQWNQTPPIPSDMFRLQSLLGM